MTVQNSKIDMHNFGKYFLHKLKTLSSFTIVQCVFAVLSYPLTAVVGVYARNLVMLSREAEAAYWLKFPAGDGTDSPEYLLMRELGKKQDLAENLLMIAVFVCICSLVVMAIMHFITEVRAFRWLYSKEAVDMDYSLPVTMDARFFGDALAGLISAAVPHLISILAGGTILFAFIPSKDNSAIDTASMVWQLMWVGFCACILFYFFNLFFMSLYGKRSHLIVMPVLMNIAIPALLILGGMLAENCTYGIYIQDWRIPFCTAPFSPIGLVIGALTVLTTSDMNLNYSIYGLFIEGYRDDWFITRPEIFITLIIVVLVYAALAWVIIRKRRAEQTGAAYVYPIARYIINGLITLEILLDFSFAFVSYIDNDVELTSIILWAVLVSFVAFLCLEIAAVGAKKLWMIMLRYLATFAAAAAVVAVLICGDTFGFMRTLPASEEISHVSIYLEEITEERFDIFPAELNEEQSIELAKKLYKELPKTKPYKTVYEGLTNAFIGNKARRGDYGEFAAEFYFVGDSNAYHHYKYFITKEQYESLFRSLCIGETLRNNEYYAHNPETYRSEMYVNLHYSVGDAFGISTDELSDEYTPISPISQEELYEAIKRDCENVTYERMIEVRARTNVRRLFVFYEIEREGESSNKPRIYLPLFDWFENTEALLREHGFDIDSVPFENEQVYQYAADEA